jgi:hypothetical protein
MINDSETTYHDNTNHSTNRRLFPNLVWGMGRLNHTSYHDTTTYKHKKRYHFRC